MSTNGLMIGGRRKLGNITYVPPEVLLHMIAIYSNFDFVLTNVYLTF